MPKEYWRQNASDYITSLKTRKVFINVLEIEPTIGQTINGSLSVTVHSAINKIRTGVTPVMAVAASLMPGIPYPGQ